MSAHRGSSATRWWTLGAVSVATFMLMLDISVVNVALPDLRRSLGADFSALQWVLDAYALSLAAFLLTSGSLADTWGRKRVFMAGFGLFVAASFACGAAQSVLALNIARGAQGVGAAVLYAVGPALLGHEFHGRQRGVAFGAFGAVAGLAFAGGPLVGGALTSGPGWRWIFFVNVPIGLAAMLITALRVRESRNPRAQGADWPGLVTFSTALTALVLGLIRVPDDGWTGTRTLGLFGVSAVLLTVFVRIERSRGPRAMLDLSLFRNRTFVGLSAVALISNMAGMPAIFLQANYVQNLLHFSPWDTGVRFLPLTVTILVFGAVAGGLVTRVPMRALFFVSLVFLGAGLLLVRRAGADSVWTVLLPSMVVTGVGMGLFNPPRAAASIGITEPARAGMAAGINETFQQVGVCLGIAGIGVLFEHQVSSAFAHSPAGAALGPQAGGAGRAIAAGAVDTVANAAGPARAAVDAAGRAAFASGLHAAILACSLLAFLAAVIALAMLRMRDLHASALNPIPPEDEPAVAEPAERPLTAPVPVASGATAA